LCTLLGHGSVSSPAGLERQGLAVIEASLIALIVLLAAGGIAVLWALVGPEALS
jgi:hypothetical protein